ncbi:histidine phosphatase family protein [Amycolatopsis acidicola]|uniref:Histidine phosphatase family protein n=1 Tax=Amycolatopsis acidicola TaxID=2596893 RepID=A0A5N0UMN0_9PSEU|nr:histidine phosphatase family protein [Amycolatopsis acidicola]KAA9151174.1 histidine phosphatase family protein [Amycolatopsis acidicola]
MALRLVRHGESEWNLAGRVQGQSPEAGPLTAKGREQAARAAGALAGCGAEAIISSDLSRARETAAIIAAELGLDVFTDPGLREQDLGFLEGRRFSDPLGEGTVQDVIDGLWREPRRHPEGGESILDLYERTHRVLSRYDGRDLVLVAHGGPVRVATTTADPSAGEPVPRLPVENAAVTLLGSFVGK